MSARTMTMRISLFSTAAAVLIATTFGALAATGTMTTGTVKSIDAKTHSLTLDNGIAYALPSGFKESGIKVGEKVTVAWVMQGVKHQADKVVVVK